MASSTQDRWRTHLYDILCSLPGQPAVHLTAADRRRPPIGGAGLQRRIGLNEPVSGRQIPITVDAAPSVDMSCGLYLLAPLQHLERLVAP